MDVDQNLESLDSLIENFDLSKPASKQRVHDGKPVSIWIPLEYKIKYDLIQGRSKQKFAKTLRQMLIYAIDRVNIDEAG